MAWEVQPSDPFNLHLFKTSYVDKERSLQPFRQLAARQDSARLGLLA